MKKRAILHIDMDAFYASVEQHDDPSLTGRPVVVTGGNTPGRGVVCAASYEARAMGVRAGMPTFRVRNCCPQAIYRVARMERYMEISRLFHTIFANYTTTIESVGLDEAFLDVTASLRLFGSAENIGHAIKKRVRTEMGLKCTIGIAHNKLLAKLGSDMGKPDGFFVFTPEIIQTRFPQIEVNKLWGVGPATDTVLTLLNVHTIADLRQCPGELLKHHLGPHAASVLHSMAYGEDLSPVVPYAPPKSFGAEETFERNIGNEQELVERLNRLVDCVAHKLRAHRMQTHTIHFKARFTDFTTVGYAHSLPTPTSLTLELRLAARALLTVRLPRDGRPLRLIGITLCNLTRAGETQDELPLFKEKNTEQWEQVDRLLDAVQQKFGPRLIHRGGTDEDYGTPPRTSTGVKIQ